MSRDSEERSINQDSAAQNHDRPSTVVLTKPGRVSLLPRWCHKIFAHAVGFFWLPCPICSEMFGGHELHWPYSSQTDPLTKRACCPRHALVVWHD